MTGQAFCTCFLDITDLSYIDKITIEIILHLICERGVNNFLESTIFLMMFSKKLDIVKILVIMNKDCVLLLEKTMNRKQVTAVILGAGHRSTIYGDVSLRMPKRLKIVAVCDIDPAKANAAAERYGIPRERVYYTLDDLVKAGRLADMVINGTLDDQHVKTALPLLALGYDMLIEKPLATNREDLEKLYGAAREYGNRIFICHVLRYASFYTAIRRVIESGEIGKVISINMAEDVSLHHMIVSYVRGQWNNENLSAPLLLAKSCHDIDLMTWMMKGNAPKKVYSVGSDYSFSPDKAPENNGSRCLLDCPREADCPYSAGKHYLDEDIPHGFYVWKSEDLTREEKIEALKTVNPYGRCVFRCGHEGVDHQVVTVTFEDGAVGVFTLTGGAPRDERRIQIVGTEGSVFGVFEENKFIIRHQNSACTYEERTVDENIPALTLHGGGDEALILDFCDYISGGEPSISFAELSESLSGHRVVFAAEESRKSGMPVTI